MLGVPRGAVPMARIIASALDGELDVVLVRKLRAPFQPELAIGAVDEAGSVLKGRYLNLAEVSEDYLREEIHTQLELSAGDVSCFSTSPGFRRSRSPRKPRARSISRSKRWSSTPTHARGPFSLSTGTGDLRPPRAKTFLLSGIVRRRASRRAEAPQSYRQPPAGSHCAPAAGSEDTVMMGSLSSEEIERLLHTEVIARLGCHAEGRTYVVPITYAYDNNSVIGHSSEGLKM